MQYTNQQPPEGINTSKKHPLQDFLILIVGAAVLIFVFSLVLGQAGGWIAKKVPFSSEIKLANKFDWEPAEDIAVEDSLRELVERVGAVMDLPEGMQLTVHYMDDDTVNAFATIGGHVIFYRGLLEKLPHENALVTLLAHEIGHIKNRHPIESLGSGIAVSLVLSTITGSGGGASIIGEAGMMTSLHYSREMEKEADAEALRAAYRLYGHIDGTDDLFKIMKRARVEMGAGEPPGFLSSHPLDDDRVDSVKRIGEENGWSSHGDLQSLPDAIANLRRSAQEN